MPRAASGSTFFNLSRSISSVGQSRAHRLDHVEVGQGVDQQPADQEFQRQVIDPAAVVAVVAPHGHHPVIDDPVAGGQGHGDEPVALAGGVAVLAD